jgi:hypothetical protein
MPRPIKYQGNHAMTNALQRLIDRAEIQDLMAVYARGVDRADWEGVRQVYHPDAIDDHGDYKGGVDGFIQFAKERNGILPQGMHFLGQCLVEFPSNQPNPDHDLAIAETYFMTAHTLTAEAAKGYRVPGADSQPVQLSHYGRYVDRVERRGGPWLIAHRICVFETTRLAIGNVPSLGADWAHQRRDQDDPIFQMRRETGLAG